MPDIDYVESPVGLITEVGWPKDLEPATFEWLDDDTGNTGVAWRMIEIGLPLRPVSEFQKLWPLGSSGSGPYDFDGIPDIEPIPWSPKIGLGVGWPSTVSGPTGEPGPWYLPGGALVATGDRPCRGYAFRIIQVGSLITYDGWVAILPTWPTTGSPTFGGLDVDFSGNTLETIAVIT